MRDRVQYNKSDSTMNYSQQVNYTGVMNCVTTVISSVPTHCTH